MKLPPANTKRTKILWYTISAAIVCTIPAIVAMRYLYLRWRRKKNDRQHTRTDIPEDKMHSGHNITPYTYEQSIDEPPPAVQYSPSRIPKASLLRYKAYSVLQRGTAPPSFHSRSSESSLAVGTIHHKEVPLPKPRMKKLAPASAIDRSHVGEPDGSVPRSPATTLSVTGESSRSGPPDYAVIFGVGSPNEISPPK